MTSAMLEQFKTKVNRVRDILRRDGITGMDSMKHCALYLAARYMTRARVVSHGVPETLAWESLLELVRSGATKDMELSRNRIYVQGATDCLVNHFDELFKTTEFNFRASAQGHADIMETLDPVVIDEIESDMDLLGWVYEAHMKTNKGSSGGSRDLGQHFTDREIIKYMVELCAPKKHESGKIDTICDPTMGTGGMLTTAVKYLTEKYDMKREDWEFNKERILGCDIDRFLGSVGSINLFMETHGVVFPHVEARDSLLNDLRGDADVILANMPFGVKGLTHAGSCCSRVKALGLNGTKSEPLFLQLMMVALAKKGRCAVVVPDGLLINASKCHNGTRKYLLDHFEVRRVIKMKGKFFMNTGIQPSILFFENTGKPTKAVEFWEVTKEDSGAMTENLLVTVPREKFDAGCVLDARRYLESEKAAANPAGFPMVKLEEVVKISCGKANYDEGGDYDFYATNGIAGKRTSYLFDGEYILTCKNQSIGSFHLVNGKFWASQNTLLMSLISDKIILKYLYYYLLINNHLVKNKASGIIPFIKNSDLYEIKMPLPPLPIQQEIVATLDRIYAPGTTELADTLKLTSQAMDLVLANPTGATLEPVVEAQRLIRKSAQMVADVKAQMVAVMKAIMARKYPVSSIGAFYETPRITKRFNSKDMNNGGDAKFFNGKWNSPVGTHSEHSYETTANYFVVIKDGGGDHSSETVGMGKFFNVSGKCAVTSHNLILTPKQANEDLHRYIHYYVSLNIKYLRDKAKYSINLGSISITDILEFPIHLPPMEDLKLHLARLDALQSQLTALETLQKQSEDNARFILESYLGSPTDTHVTEEASETEGATIEHV
jgi:restriction endonuclease S subunit